MRNIILFFFIICLLACASATQREEEKSTIIKANQNQPNHEKLKQGEKYESMALDAFEKKEYEKAWEYIKKAKSAGYYVYPKFIAFLSAQLGVEDLSLIKESDQDLFYNTRGEKFLEKAQYDRAISDFNKALKVNPKYWMSYFSRGKAYAQKGQYDQAISDYSKALKNSPYAYSTDIRRLRAESYYHKKEYGKAWEDVRDIQSQNQEIDPKFLDNLEKASGKKEDYATWLAARNRKMEESHQKWMEKHKKAIEDPRNAEEFTIRGNSKLKESSLTEAIADFNKAIALDKKYAPAYNGRAFSYFLKRDFDRTITELNIALEIDPKYVDAYRTRGMAYLGKGLYDLAINDFNKALEGIPEENIILRTINSTLYKMRTEAYIRKGLYDQAVLDMNRYMKHLSMDAEAFFLRGEAYKGKGQLDQAIADFTKSIQISLLIKTLHSRAEAYYLKKDYENAWRDVKHAELKGHPVSEDFLRKLRRASGRKE